jgi:hypothetical protein
MADTKEAPAAIARSAVATAAEASANEESADAERRLARYAARGIPLVTVAAALGTGFFVGLGPAILVLAAGTLLGTIALLWASLRTLSGDAPLPTDLEAVAIRSRKVDNLGEQKRRVLRALKDLELEHSVGKIDDKDFASLGDRFRADAKALMREMDGQIDPFREEAERLAQRHLEKRGLGDGAPPPKRAKPAKPTKPADDEDDDDANEASDAEERAVAEDEVPEREPAVVAPAKPSKPAKPKSPKPAPDVVASPSRVACPKCDVSNEPDASFCKKCGASLTAEESHA